MDKYKEFPITSICRADIDSIGFDSTKLDDADMTHLASKLADAYCDNGFWEDLEIILEMRFNLTKN